MDEHRERRFKTKCAIKYLKEHQVGSVQFNNSKDIDIHIFLFIDGGIGIGEIGNGYVHPFNPNDYINDMWIMKCNV